MGGQFGVKETKELLDLGFAVVEAGKGVMADGKVTFTDVAYVVPVFPKLEAGLAGAALAPKELGELDEADEKELLDYTKAKLPGAISDELLRAKVFAYLRVGLAFAHALSV